VEENLASFSSIGPLYDGRIKPDVVAPGFNILSAASTATPQKCPTAGGAAAAGEKRVTQMAGTSMATPVVAGNAALVRQYFTEGWYPVGAKRTQHSFKPLGSLVKAVLINSGRYLTGKIGTTGAQLATNAPSQEQGFGLVGIARALHMKDAASSESDGARDLFVVGDFEKQKKLAVGETHEYTLEVTSSFAKSGAAPVTTLTVNGKTYTR
jgi:subtilisin family serine protease